jgi:hypothetical protein
MLRDAQVLKDGSGPDIIGPLLAPEPPWALIEYLKTL